ncbi:MAG: DUF1254 domain-containing protein [Mesorhizobium sp.]|nr:DUF1254 domain-containing protein [Mesorhizobium sp.]
MARLVYAIILGIVGAGIVHIAILLLIPVFSERDAWSRIASVTEPYTIFPLGRADLSADILKTADPLFDVAVCQFDLAQGVVRIAAAAKVPFWSLSVFDRRGRNVYSLNDRTATDGRLDIVVATPVQLIELRKDMPAGLEKSIFIEADIGEGMVVLRSFIPDPTWRPSVEAYLASATCEAV